MRRIAEWVARRPENERNHGLFWGACKLAERGVAQAEASDVLTRAAMTAGLGEREAARTVRSAYRTTHPTTSTAPRPTEPAAASPVRVPVGAFVADGQVRYYALKNDAQPQA